jgi:putative salt-induced outer membrane protein YdiY
MSRRLLHVIATFILFLGASITALADQLTLKNGDRVSGQIVKSEGGKLTVKTEFMGTVEIAWDAIEKLTSDKVVYLTLKDELTVVGTINAAGDQYEVQTKEMGKVSLAKASIASLRNEAEYNSWKAEIDRLKNPGLLDLWTGALDVGLSLARGNAEANTFTLGANAVRATPRDKLSFYAASLRTSARKRTERDFTAVANAIRGGGRYDVNLTSRSFAFGFGDLEFDEFQNLDLRMTLGGGMGWRAIKNENTSFDLFGGGAYTKEYFSAGTPRNRSRAEALVGEELTHKISARSLFRERLVFFPNLEQGGEYRLQFDTSLVTSLNRWLAWQITLSDRYLSNPPVVTPALKKNDTLLTTGLRFTFAK